MERGDLAGLQTFLAIVEHGSLSAAARALGVRPPAVSQQLKAFERRLGAALFVRSTRSVRLTDAGTLLLERSASPMAAIDDSLALVSGARASRAGPLRITLPYRAWQLVVAPGLEGFRERCPDIELELSIDEGLADIVAAGFHAGIRLGDRLQEGMVGVRLSAAEPAVCVASPGYLERHGTPSCPDELIGHRCIRYRETTSGRIAGWRFATEAGERTVVPGGPLTVNDLRTCVDAAERGAGIAWTLERGVRTLLGEGRLVRVLAAHALERDGFHLYFPASLRDLGVLRAFVESFRLG